jgi:DNA-binding beta-propeller fold protein YncE
VLRSQKLADEISEIHLSPDGRKLLALVNHGSGIVIAERGTVKRLRLQKLKVPAATCDVPPPPLPGEVAKPSLIANSTGKQQTLGILNYQTGESWQASMPGEIGAVRFRADGQLVLAANLTGRSLIALTVPDLKVVAELPLAMEPENLCFNADQGQLFVSGDGMDAVAIVFPYNTLEVDQTILAGRDPGVMGCSGTPAYLFVGSRSGSDVCVVDIDRRKVIGIVDVGQRPSYITVTPDDQYTLILDEMSGDMAVIHVPAIRTNRTKSGASLFTVLPVGDKPVHAAVMHAAA